MKKLIDLTGQRFGRLIVVKYHGQSKNRMFLFECRCDCGSFVVKRGNHLIRGEVKSCGCFRRDFSAHLGSETAKHGCCETPSYESWSAMKQRCLNPNHQWYKNYGGRGIAICQRWMDFENFFDDMGERPPGTNLERKDNNSNYEPGNCKWATPKEQGRNRRDNRLISFAGITRCLSEWSEISGLKITTIRERINRGWSIEDALTEPVYVE